MKCPKCGAIIENGKTMCFMCGNNLSESSVEEQNEVFNDFSSSNDFGSGDSYQAEYEKKKEEYNNRFNDYKNVDINDYKNINGKKDIFDFYNEHKKAIKIVLLILFLSLSSFIGYKIYKYKTRPIAVKPIVNELYFEIDDDFVQTSDKNSRDGIVYTKSGNKGSDCSITISYGSSTSGDHVEDYYENMKKKLQPKTDKEGNVLDQSEVFIGQESSVAINDNFWYFLSIYYRSNIESNQYDILKYRFYTSVYKGYYYDIELANPSNTATCNASLDNFVSSLKFIDLK